MTLTIMKDDVPSSKDVFICYVSSSKKARGPYYYCKEPDPMEDFEGYAAHSEFFDHLFTRMKHFQQRIHDVSSTANNDRLGIEVFGGDFLLLS